MVHMAMKVERQLIRKGHVQLAFNSSSSSSWKSNLKREEIAQPKLFVPTKAKPPKAKVEASTSFKGKSDTQRKCTRDVKCFRCQGLYASRYPNKRIIMTRGKYDMKFKSDKSNCEDMPPLKNCIEDELTLPIKESLVIRHTF